MFAGLLAVLLTGDPYVVSTDFPQAAQEAARVATLRMWNPEPRLEGSAVRVKSFPTFTYYLTAAHNLQGSKKVDLECFEQVDAKEPTRIIKLADVLHFWLNEDLALLRATEANPVPCLEICPKSKIPKAKVFPALAVGCTRGLPPSFMLDTVYERKFIKRKDHSQTHYWVTKEVPIIGRSGGPLVTKDGFLIGICSGTQGTNGYYVDILTIHRLLDEVNHGFLFAEAGK